VEIVTALRFAPYQFVVLWVEIHVADGALAVGWFAISALGTVVLAALSVICGNWRCLFEDLLKLWA